MEGKYYVYQRLRWVDVLFRIERREGTGGTFSLRVVLSLFGFFRFRIGRNCLVLWLFLSFELGIFYLFADFSYCLLY